MATTWTYGTKNSTSWTFPNRSAVGDADYLLTEDDFYLLKEDDTKILLEQSAEATAWTFGTKN